MSASQRLDNHVQKSTSNKIESILNTSLFPCFVIYFWIISWLIGRNPYLHAPMYVGLHTCISDLSAFVPVWLKHPGFKQQDLEDWCQAERVVMTALTQ